MSLSITQIRFIQHAMSTPVTRSYELYPHVSIKSVSVFMTPNVPHQSRRDQDRENLSNGVFKMEMR